MAEGVPPRKAWRQIKEGHGAPSPGGRPHVNTEPDWGTGGAIAILRREACGLRLGRIFLEYLIDASLQSLGILLGSRANRPGRHALEDKLISTRVCHVND